MGQTLDLCESSGPMSTLLQEGLIGKANEAATEVDGTLVCLYVILDLR